jgi:hypothetical protein
VSIVCRVNSKIDESHHFRELSNSQLNSLTFYQERKRQGRVTSLFLLYTQSKDVHGSAQHENQFDKPKTYFLFLDGWFTVHDDKAVIHILCLKFK